MTSYVIPSPPQASVAVAGTDARFPIRRVLCVGRNYAAHAREMGNDEKDPPFFFAKPADAVIDSGLTIPFPSVTEDLHFEMELVVAIKTGGADINVGSALDHVFGYGCGIDLTRRDIQAIAKAARRPWEMGKAFDRSAPMSEIHSVEDLGHHLGDARIWLERDGEIQQEGKLGEQIWQVQDMIAHLSALIELAPGDLIMTGTPAGVGPVKRGETLVGGIDGLTEVSVTFEP